MGTNQSCCSIRTRQQGSTLDKKEVFLLCDVLKHSQLQQNVSSLDVNCFRRIFPDNPCFGEQVYEYCCSQLDVELLPIEGCMTILQQVLSANDLTPTLLSICMESYDTQAQIIDAQQAFQFFGLITSIYLQFCLHKQQIDASVIELLVNSIFREKQMKKIDFLAIIDANFPHINKLIKIYLSNRLLQKPFSQMRIAKIDKDSFILKYEWLAILGLASAELHKHGQFTLLYQSALVGITYADIFVAMQQPQSLIVTTFQDNNAKLTIAIYYKKQWNPDSKEFQLQDSTIAFQLYPKFQIFRLQASKMYFNHDGFGYAKVNDRFLVYLGDGKNYCMNSTKLLTIEIWKCEELQSKLRKSVIEDDRASVSPKGEKKRVSFRMQEDQPTRKSMSVNTHVFEKNFEVNEASSPQSPHFKGDESKQPTFNNPQSQQIIQSSYQTQGSKSVKQQQNNNRPSQSIIEKYSVKKSQVTNVSQNNNNVTNNNNNSDLRKSVDDILKRYERNKQL